MKWIIGTLVVATRPACRPVLTSAEMAAHARADRRPSDVVMFCEPCGDRVPGEPPRPYRAAGRGPLRRPTDRSRLHVHPDLAAPLRQPRRARRLPDRGRVTEPAGRGGDRPRRLDRARLERAGRDPPDARDPEAPVELAPTVIVQTTTTGLGWSAIAGGCGATSLLWLVALRLRRRRAHRPRLG